MDHPVKPGDDGSGPMKTNLTFTPISKKNVADFERIVPERIEVRRFVREEADAVAEVVIEDTDGGLVQDRLRLVE